ncbi:very short patch repair endonuclease [Mesorhizobium sp. M1148]|uniref:very short patch repair endonuclease n=1 Tax=unclassified Mesorhizobium TaxID=325217 RepID=UPI00333BC539
MADIVSPEGRSRMMSGIRGKNTRPELTLRRGLHALGFRFRLHQRSIPGQPDLVFPRRQAVLFAHGCFWHGHDCHLFRLPSTRPEFWSAKIAANKARDAVVEAALAGAGWRHGVVWECAIKGRTKLPAGDVIAQCAAWLESTHQQLAIRGRE